MAAGRSAVGRVCPALARMASMSSIGGSAVGLEALGCGAGLPCAGQDGLDVIKLGLGRWPRAAHPRARLPCAGQDGLDAVALRLGR